jgi:hypothetical protein
VTVFFEAKGESLSLTETPRAIAGATRDAQPSIRDRPEFRTSPGNENPRDAAIQHHDDR